MTVVLRRSGRVVLAALLSGLLVWWTLVIVGAVFAVASNLRSTTEVAGPGLLGALYIGVLGMIYAVPISIVAGLASLPSALLATSWFERPGTAGAWTFTIGGTACAVITAVVVWLGIWAKAALASPVAVSQAVDWLYPLLWLTVGGPIAGFIYWRLARRELRAAPVVTNSA